MEPTPRPPADILPSKHVVFIIKENRTYDQVFGDLKEGDGDPNLVFFGWDVSPTIMRSRSTLGCSIVFSPQRCGSQSAGAHLVNGCLRDRLRREAGSPPLIQIAEAPLTARKIDEPIGGFLWNLAAKKGIWFPYWW